jgi:hypothetical protein
LLHYDREFPPIQSLVLRLDLLRHIELVGWSERCRQDKLIHLREIEKVGSNTKYKLDLEAECRKEIIEFILNFPYIQNTKMQNPNNQIQASERALRHENRSQQQRALEEQQEQQREERRQQ